MEISVQEVDFDVGAEIAALTAEDHEAGAVASFVGLVRGGEVAAMTLEHYPGMTEQALADIVSTARARWALRGVRVIHRIGRLLPGDRIVFVGVASSHRSDAFDACAFIMDYLKTQAPFWKKEDVTDAAAGAPGATCSRWVDARESDNLAARRWLGGET